MNSTIQVYNASFLNLVVDRVKDGDDDGQQNFGDVPEMAMAAIMK